MSIANNGPLWPLSASRVRPDDPSFPTSGGHSVPPPLVLAARPPLSMWGGLNLASHALSERNEGQLRPFAPGRSTYVRGSTQHVFEESLDAISTSPLCQLHINHWYLILCTVLH